ncbi:MAG: NAD(P)/FAD-dependent oxidoreductase [Pseudomonadota bacterium]
MDDGHKAEAPAEHFDVLVVGAGISGIGAGYHLQQQCPDMSFVILETFEAFGGTWWSHRYPGIRSDSDLYTFGYRFKPWVGPPIATAEEILNYMGEVIADNDLARHIRYRHRITDAVWSSEANRWTITAVSDVGEVRFTCGFLYMGQGYYRQREGFWPKWPGMQDYQGQLVHSEEWTDDIDFRGKRVVVIGSGASAATIVPNMCDDAAHVVMLQRSPTFFRTGRNAIPIADQLRRLQIDEAWIHEITRKQILFEQSTFTETTFSDPEKVREDLIGEIRKLLGPDYDVDRHFTPRYRPWRQRIAFVPDADLFERIAAGDASVVTDEIERFTSDGILLKSGEKLQADMIVAATGFNMNTLGDIAFAVDGAPVDFHDTVTYRGMMFTGLPNMVWVFGYFRASWTLRVDIVCDFVCRLLNYMKGAGVDRVEVALRPEDADMPISEWVSGDNFNPGYVTRSLHLLPRAGNKPEWQHTQDYWADKDDFPEIDLTGEEFLYDGTRSVRPGVAAE